MRSQLKSVTLKGFKTFECLENFELGPMTVLIGPNGAGKSNFLSFFGMLGGSLAAPDDLPRYVAQAGGAGSLLHCGPSRTSEIEAELKVQTGGEESQYRFQLVLASGDTLIFADERRRTAVEASKQKAMWEVSEPGHSYPRLLFDSPDGRFGDLLRDAVVYHFHNTSGTARIRHKWSVGDNRALASDAGNLAPVLLRLKASEAAYYRRIVGTVRLILPHFSDFELEPEAGRVELKWREKAIDVPLAAGQASDGMLRTMALVTLLLQPERDLPDLLLLDEPELGVTPYADEIVGGLIRSASHSVQVVVAAQSAALLNCFDPAEVVIVERKDGRTTLKRLDEDRVGEWLDEYSLSELWEMNILGGRH